MKNILSLSLRLQTLPPIRRTAWVLSLMAASFVWAGPGAHGPNGEHLDTAAAPSASGLARLPDGSVHIPKLAQRRMGLRTVLAPDKINLASLGNVVPHLHWHVIPRFADDAHFPAPVWAARARDGVAHGRPDLAAALREVLGTNPPAPQGLA